MNSDSTLKVVPALRETLRVATSGARAVEPFELEGHSFLAVPQLALDAEGSPPGMNGGNSDTDLLLLRRAAAGYVEHQRIAAPGGEDAEFFTIGPDAFLAVASIRSGAGPYDYDISSIVHRWDGTRFEPFQAISTFAAKQWRHFMIDGRHFLALAQGVSLPQHAERNRPSVIFVWDGTWFEPFQEIPSQWAYNWHHFTVAGEHYLAHADHVQPARLYRWDGRAFVEHQELVSEGSRAFATFSAEGQLYLACAVLNGDSRLFRWEGTRFVPHQVLPGAGGRELAVVVRAGRIYLVRINFLLGPREAPTTSLESQIYRWDNGKLVEVLRFPTSGGTDVAVLPGSDGMRLAVSNSLSADVRFSTDTRIYEFDAGD